LNIFWHNVDNIMEVPYVICVAIVGCEGENVLKVWGLELYRSQGVSKCYIIFTSCACAQALSVRFDEHSVHCILVTWIWLRACGKCMPSLGLLTTVSIGSAASEGQAAAAPKVEAPAVGAGYSSKEQVRISVLHSRLCLCTCVCVGSSS